MIRQRTPTAALLLLVLAACQDDGGVTPPITPTDSGHVFTYTRPAGAPALQSVSVRGTFNGWGETPMAQLPDGSWHVLVQLDSVKQQYKFFINGEWPHDMCYDETWGHPEEEYWVDPDADGCEDDGYGGGNALLLFGQQLGLGFVHSASSPAHVSAADGRLSIRFRVNAGQLQSATLTAGAQTFPMHLQLRRGTQEVWRASVPEGTTSYRITVAQETGAQEFGPYNAPAAPFRAVEWVRQGVGYQIFPERFWNGDPTNDSLGPATDAYHFLHPDLRGSPPVLTEQWDGPITHMHCCSQYFGGDLQGIIDRLDHLEALGVTLLYLNPIFTSGSAHGYDASDFMEIAPNFGTEQTARTLIDAARARGIRVMWDFVPNHVGVGHWAFQHAVHNGTSSPYWNWFRFHVPQDSIRVGDGRHYDGWWGIGRLPELTTTRADVFEHLMSVTRYWTEFGFDGIRVDVPEEIENPREFFRAFRNTAKSINPDAYLIAEVWSRSPIWLQGDEFDSLMNYAIGLAVIQSFVIGGKNGGAAAQDMTQLYMDYPEAATAMQFNIISSHDTHRLLTLLGAGTLGHTPSAVGLARGRLASAMLYALPGIPVTFQGDECGFLGAHGGAPYYDQHRYPIQWNSCNPEILAHYRRLAELRQTLPALRSPVIRTPAGVGPLLSFSRGEPGAGEILAVFNRALDGQAFTLPAGTWADAASGQTVSGTIQLEPLGWYYLERR
jgi:cyclomaltodextrinase / maltogenic alpha-amylase / neopullulanase